MKERKNKKHRRNKRRRRVERSRRERILSTEKNPLKRKEKRKTGRK